MAAPLETATHVRDSLKGIILDTLDGSYVLGEILYRRGDRYIIRAQRMDASGCLDTPRLVMKISLHAALPAPEVKLVHKARKVAIDAGGDTHWVLQHLPHILYTEVLQMIPGSTQARISQIIDDIFCHCESCEERVLCDEQPETLRIVIMEELFPINTLSKTSDFAQVFFDVLNCYKWLYDNPRILHRDISMGNIMHRFDDEHNVCGVLNDMDLSSDLDDNDTNATLLRRTGTPPFMAIDLLRKYSLHPGHIYRHDLESLFYVMLLVVTRYKLRASQPIPSHIPAKEERLQKRSHSPLNEWFNSHRTWEALADDKSLFIASGYYYSTLDTDKIISSSFEGFKEWISDLRDALGDGFMARDRALRQEKKARKIGNVPAPGPFNHETLGGEVQYSTFFNLMKDFEGKALRAPPQSDNVDVSMKL